MPRSKIPVPSTPLTSRLLRGGLTLMVPFVLLSILVIGGSHIIGFLSQRNADGVPPGMKAISTIFTPEVRHWSPLIYAWAGAYQVDPNLVATLIQIESCGDPKAVSSSGAQGLFQVMPFHFSKGESMLDVVINGQHGMQYLVGAMQLSKGDVTLAMAGYNGGHSVISRAPDKWPAETRRYAQWATGIYQEATNNGQSSPTLDAWLAAGGLKLCQRASQSEANP